MKQLVVKKCRSGFVNKTDQIFRVEAESLAAADISRITFKHLPPNPNWVYDNLPWAEDLLRREAKLKEEAIADKLLRTKVGHPEM